MESGSEQARTEHARPPSPHVVLRPGGEGEARHGATQSDAVRIAFSNLAASGAPIRRAGPPRLVTAHAGDHALVYSLLRAVHQAPSHEDFISWLDEPSYEPTDRLLVKQGDQIVAHAQLLPRDAWFHGVRLPVVGLQDVAVLPEYVQAGYERLLLYAAEQTMRDGGAVVSIVRTERPEPLRDSGWTEARVPGYSRASVGDVLAHLAAPRRHGDGAPARYAGGRPMRALPVRRWRHVELDAVRAVYAAASVDGWGALCRAEPYWRWLIGRKAHSELIIAVDKPVGDDASDGPRAEPPIVGYAVTHGSQVLELCCLPGYTRAGPRMLGRACQDAIERDYHTISLHTPACDPLHELMVTAGGTWCSDRGAVGTLLVKLLDPPRWTEALFPLLRQRAKAAGLKRPCEICFDTGAETHRLVLTRRSSRLIADASAQPQVRCDGATFSSLLIGNLDAAELHANGRLESTGHDVLDTLAVLFPPALFWQSQFDALRF